MKSSTAADDVEQLHLAGPEVFLRNAAPRSQQVWQTGSRRSKAEPVAANAIADPGAARP